jgi:hypothetical protein
VVRPIRIGFPEASVNLQNAKICHGYYATVGTRLLVTEITGTCDVVTYRAAMRKSGLHQALKSAPVLDHKSRALHFEQVFFLEI